jgi:hypothetical protein
MRWYWWLALFGGLYYFSKKLPKNGALVNQVTTSTDPEKLGLIKAVSDKVASKGINNVTMTVEKDGSMTFIGQKLENNVHIPVVIGRFNSPDAVNEWAKTLNGTTI